MISFLLFFLLFIPGVFRKPLFHISLPSFIYFLSLFPPWPRISPSRKQSVPPEERETLDGFCCCLIKASCTSKLMLARCSTIRCQRYFCVFSCVCYSLYSPRWSIRRIKDLLLPYTNREIFSSRGNKIILLKLCSGCMLRDVGKFRRVLNFLKHSFIEVYFCIICNTFLTHVNNCSTPKSVNYKVPATALSCSVRVPSPPLFIVFEDDH